MKTWPETTIHHQRWPLIGLFPLLTHPELCKSQCRPLQEVAGRLHLPSTAGGTSSHQRTHPPSHPDLQEKEGRKVNHGHCRHILPHRILMFFCFYNKPTMATRTQREATKKRKCRTDKYCSYLLILFCSCWNKSSVVNFSCFCFECLRKQQIFLVLNMMIIHSIWRDDNKVATEREDTCWVIPSMKSEVMFVTTWWLEDEQASECPKQKQAWQPSAFTSPRL